MQDAEAELRLLQSAVNRLSPKPARNFLELSRAVSRLKLLDQNGFAKFIATSGLNRRTAYYFLELAKIKYEHELTDAQVEGIGWTKFQLIGKHLTKRDRNELLRQARSATVSQLRAMLTEGRSTSRCILLRFTAEEFALLSKAVVAHGGRKRGKGLVGAEAAILAMSAANLDNNTGD